MEITITETSWLGVNWSLLSAFLAATGTIATAAVAWIQLTGFRTEAQLSRRPVLETRVMHAKRVEIGIIEEDGAISPRIRRTIGIQIQNVGEGRAVNIKAYGHFEPIASVGENPTILTKSDIDELRHTATHHITAENLPSGAVRDLTLAGPEYSEIDDPMKGWMAARVIVTYEDVYGTVFTPVSESVTGFGASSENLPPPPGSVVRREE